MLAHLGLLFLALGATPPDASASDKFFAHDGPVPVIKVEVPKESLYSLRSEPRKNVKCTVRMGEQVWSDVSVHIKGAAGSTRPWDDLPALTLTFDDNKRGGRFLGVHDKLHLNNSVQDARCMTEILSSKMYRDAGVPCARATHALVELNERKVGVYVAVEGYDTHFLKQTFQGASGNFYDGEFLKEIDQPLKRTHGSGDVGDGLDLQALAAASRERDLTKRYAMVAELCDLDRFFSMMAVEVAAWHWDGYCMNKNNYRLYHDPKTKKFVFLPHGMDQLWHVPTGPINPRFQGLIARKLMETTEGKEMIRKKLEDVMDKSYKTDEMIQEIDTLVARLKVVMEPVNPGRMKQIEAANDGLKKAIKAREDYIREQLKK